MKLGKLLLVLVVLGGIAVAVAVWTDGSASETASEAPAEKPQDGPGGPMLEERYGFTSQGVGG
jgi:hypothetical protein